MRSSRPSAEPTRCRPRRTEDAAEQLRRQAGAAHAEHGGAPIAVLADVAGKVLELGDPRATSSSGRSSQPSQAAISSGGLPEAAHSEPSFAHSRSATRSAVHDSSRAVTAASSVGHAGASSSRFDSIVPISSSKLFEKRGDALGDELVR